MAVYFVKRNWNKNKLNDLSVYIEDIRMTTVSESAFNSSWNLVDHDYHSLTAMLDALLIDEESIVLQMSDDSIFKYELIQPQLNSRRQVSVISTDLIPFDHVTIQMLVTLHSIRISLIIYSHSLFVVDLSTAADRSNRPNAVE